MEGAANALEDGLGDMVIILAADAMDVEGDSGMGRERAEKLADVLGAECADALSDKWALKGQDAAPTDVHRHENEGLVHRGMEARVALNRIRLKRLAESPTQHDADILDGVMVIDVQIALDREAQIELAMEGKLLQKMIEKAHLR